MFRRLCCLVNYLSGVHIKSIAVEQDRSFPKSTDMSSERELSPEYNDLVSRPIPQEASPVAKPAAPRVAAREIARTAIICNEQRSPSEDEFCSLAGLSSESSRLADTGPLLPALQTYLTHPDSRTAFTLDQQLWTHLSGNNTRFWSNRAHRQDVDDRPLYAPLDEARREIRVLKISRTDQRGDGGGDTFQADLVRVSLDEDPAYLAISYVWSDPSIMGHFESHHGGHGKRVPYNKAVFDIINTILGRDTTLYFWIDALCINQEDLNERASQVAMMGIIYSQARQVIAFIGEADETLITAMDLILLTANCIWSHGSLSDSATASGLASLLSEIGPADRDWESIKELMSRPWFGRLWVVQEIALGKDPVVVCGKHVLPWSALTLFIGFTQTTSEFPVVLDSAAYSTFDAGRTVSKSLLNAAGISDACRGQSNDCPGMPFIFSLVSLNAHFDSTDPRDRIYALLGLDTAKKYRDVFRPDYEIKVEDLYVKVAREMIVKEHNIRFLHLAGISYRRSLSLPSWVPDWMSLPKNLVHNMDLSGPLVQEGDTKVHQPRFSFDPSPLVLTLYGRVNDSIALITHDPYPGFPSSRGQPYHETTASYMDAVMKLVHATHPDSVGKPPHEFLWMQQLMETLSASGSPLGDYMAQRQKVVDDMGTVRTYTVTEVGFCKFLERLRCWSCDRYVVPDMGVEESDFTNFFCSATVGRRFYVSSAGHFGLVAGDARVGDYVCMFEGHQVPFVVRPVDVTDKSKGGYLVGEAVSTYSGYCNHHERIRPAKLVQISLPTYRSSPRLSGRGL